MSVSRVNPIMHMEDYIESLRYLQGSYARKYVISIIKMELLALTVNSTQSSVAMAVQNY